jgi:AcrR family transcriptional regulator
MSCGSIGLVARMTREASKAQTRERLISEAQRLFRERGYFATSLDQIALAADVTKGAIYGHFSSKEDLLLSVYELAPTPDFGSTALYDESRPLRERLAEFGHDLAVDEDIIDRAGLAVQLEFIAALLRSPDALRRYADNLSRRLAELAATDEDEPIAGVTTVQAWAIGYALLRGLQINRCTAPEIFTPSVFEHAYELLAGLYPEE